MVISLPDSRMLVLRATHSLAAAMPQRTSSRALQAWRMMTLPFWFGSDVPAPSLPALHPQLLRLDSEGAAAGWLGHTIDALTMRFWISWIVSTTLRGSALGAIVAVLWSLGAAIDWLPTPTIRLIVLLVVVGAIPGLLLGLVNRPSPYRVASMLDRTFELDERVITAIDARERRDPEIETMQRADAANALATVLREIRVVHLMPVREIVLVMAMVTTALAVWMFAFDPRQVDAVTDLRVPGYYPASERLADEIGALPRQPTPPATSDEQTASTQSDPSTGKSPLLEDLGQLGKALDQHALTDAAAGALASGDVAGAAAQLDNAASNIANASQDERNALADDLDKAANAMSGDNPDLAQQTRDSADAIREGGSTAEGGVKDLSDAVEAAAPATSEGDQGTTSKSSSSSNSSAPVGEQVSGGTSNSNGNASASDSDTTEGAPSGSSQPSSADPGAGSDAQPGIGEAPSDDQAQAGGAQPGGSEGNANSGDGEGPGAGGDQQGAGSTSSAPGSTGGAPGDSNAAMGEAQDETSSSQGSGAGGGQQDANDAPVEGQAPNTTSSGPGDASQGAPGDYVTPAAAPVGENGEGGAAGNGTNTIDIGGTSNETVQSGNDTGSSSLGSGNAGAEVGSGDAAPQAVGPAGPDSNHVPAEYEDVVGDYFAEP